ncbi:unnamed protein product, partial [Rotaria sp. Silwood2]
TGSSQEISTGASFSAQTETSQSSGSPTINTATVGSSAPVTFSSQSSLYTGASQESGTGASLPTQTETSQSSGSTAVNTATVPPTSAVTFSTPSVTYASVSQESSSGMSFSSQTGTSQFVTSGSEGSSGIITSVTQTPSSSAIPVLSTQSFDPNNSTLVETLRRGLSAVINFGFLCFNNPFNQECSQLSRRKRQTNQNYLIEIIPPVTLLSDANTYPKTYRVYYTVTDLSTNKSVSAAAVQSATDKLTNTQKVTLLGFIFEGNLIQSPNISHTVSTPTTDSKLWIIGAVLGPIAFVLLLIILFCFIYARCRKQGNNQSTAEAVYNIPQISSRASNYQTASNELRQEQATPLNNVRVLTQNDILLGNTASSKQLPPIKSQTASNNMPQYPVSVDIPMQETRHLNDVEHWRNKLRLQEKFEQHYADPLNDLDQVYHSSVPRTTTPRK